MQRRAENCIKTRLNAKSFTGLKSFGPDTYCEMNDSDLLGQSVLVNFCGRPIKGDFANPDGKGLLVMVRGRSPSHPKDDAREYLKVSDAHRAATIHRINGGRLEFEITEIFHRSDIVADRPKPNLDFPEQARA